MFYARTVLGADNTGASIVVAAGGVGGAIGAFVATRAAKALGEQLPVVLAVCGLGASLALMGASRSMPFLIALNVLLIGFSLLANVIIQGMRQRIVPRELLGRVSSTSRVLMLSSYQLGVLLTGSLTEVTGGDPRWVFVVAGVLSVALGVAVWYGALRPRGGVRVGQPGRSPEDRASTGTPQEQQ